MNACYESLGPKRTEALLAFHVFTGCDQTSRFCGKSKSSWWKNFMKAHNEVLNVFKNLGIGADLPTFETLESLEGFVVELYGGVNRPQKHYIIVRFALVPVFEISNRGREITTYLRSIKV